MENTELGKTLIEKIIDGSLKTVRSTKHPGSKRKYNFKKVKRNRQISKKSRRINRGK